MSFKLQVLGSGIAAPFDNRMPSGYLVITGNTEILLECNPFTIGARLSAINITSISGILVTHAHNDHSGGEVAFLEAFRTRHKILGKPIPPFTLCGPAPNRFFKTYLKKQLQWRWPELPEEDCFWKIPSELNRFSLGDAWITAFPVNRVPEMPAVGYHIQYGNQSLVYCGDFGTTQFQNVNTLGQWITDADLLILDCGAPTESPAT